MLQRDERLYVRLYTIHNVQEMNGDTRGWHLGLIVSRKFVMWG